MKSPAILNEENVGISDMSKVLYQVLQNYMYAYKLQTITSMKFTNFTFYS